MSNRHKQGFLLSFVRRLFAVAGCISVRSSSQCACVTPPCSAPGVLHNRFWVGRHGRWLAYRVAREECRCAPLFIKRSVLFLCSLVIRVPLFSCKLVWPLVWLQALFARAELLIVLLDAAISKGENYGHRQPFLTDRSAPSVPAGADAAGALRDLAIASSTVQAQDGNLLSNTGFETGSASWDLCGNAAIVDNQAAGVTGAMVRSGRRALRLMDTDNGCGSVIFDPYAAAGPSC